MLSTCSYCNQLAKAIKSNNFCSKGGNDMHILKSNAFYFKSKYLHSGEHISRLTLRSINRGYQYHEMGKRKIMLDAQQYLITNEGEQYKSEVNTNHPIEGLVIAFSHEQAHSMGYYLDATTEQLLDNPFRKTNNLQFNQATFRQTHEIQSILAQLKLAILHQESQLIDYDEKFHQLMLLILKDRQSLQAKVGAMKEKKPSTRIEIFKRLNIGKEYLDLHLQDNINLEKLSRICTMSPFHLLRSFKAFYGQTPHQYLTRKRLQKAQFLLKDTTLPIKQIAMLTGFEHTRSFRRLFKKKCQLSPKIFRVKFE